MIPIVFSTDHNYVMPTGVTVLSLFLSNPGETFDIFILCGEDVTEDDKGMLTKQVEAVSNLSKLNFIGLSDSFSGAHEIRDISVACYYRLLIPWLIPQYDKIIYSDVDIIFNGEIADFYNQNLEDCVAGVNMPGYTSNKRTAKYISKIGLNPAHYINSGFILINSAKQREDNLKPRYLELAKRKFLFQDQDILNIVAKDRISLAEAKYNSSPRMISPMGNIRIEDVVVIHYAGDKPWKTFTLRWREWWDVYDQSIFYDPNACEKVAAKALNTKEWVKAQWGKFKSKYLHK